MDDVFDQITKQSDSPHCEKNNQIEPTSEFEGDDEILSGDDKALVDGGGVERTDRRIREVSQELLRHGLLEQSSKPNLYRVTVSEEAAVNAIVEPLDLGVKLDEVRGLAFLFALRPTDAEGPEDEWSHPLVRKQRLNLEQSILVAILRQYFVASELEAGIGASLALVSIDELVSQMQVFLGDKGSEASERKRMRALLDQLKDHGLVSAPDQHERVTIRPIIAHLASPDTLEALLDWLKQQVLAKDAAESEGIEL